MSKFNPLREFHNAALELSSKRALKRDNWTNQEVIDILKGLRLVGRDGKELSEEDGGDWNAALSVAISQFYDFKRDANEYAAMAYDTETKTISVVGQPLPR
jgi:hypothetical protein